MLKTPWKKVVSDPNYIGEADFQENEEKILTIDRVNASETAVTAEGKSKRAVVHWRESGNKPMILNVVRFKNIEKVAGSRSLKDWPGVQVQLYIEHGIKAFGEVVSAVRVRPYKPRPKQAIPPCMDCGKLIEAAMGRTADYMANYTVKKYGAPLYASCAQSRAEQAQSAAAQTNGEEAPDNGGEDPAGGDSGELL